MILTIVKNLEKGVNLLESLSDNEYSKNSTPPYYSSIGSHIRHILDVYHCILIGLENKYVDLTNRNRNAIQEKSTKEGLLYLQQIINKIQLISSKDLEKQIVLADDLGDGKIEVTYSLAAILMQAHSHKIHHYAIIGFLIYDLGIELPDTDFGYNPTTPKKELLG